MSQNATVTAFTLFELLRENQQGRGEGGKITPSPHHTQIRVKETLPQLPIIFLNKTLKYKFWHKFISIQKFFPAAPVLLARKTSLDHSDYLA